MSKLKQWLSGLLILQVILAGGLFMKANRDVEFNSDQKLVALSPDTIDKIVIEGDNETAVLKREAGAWVLPSYHTLPAKQEKIDEAINKLLEAKSGWPIATSTGSQKRLEVTEDAFQRRIRFYSGDTLSYELFLGTSPSYRNVHARLADQDDVYSIKLAKHDFPSKNNDWLDNTVLQVSEITRVKGDDFELAREGETWKLINAENAPQLDTDKLLEFNDLFNSIWVQEVAGVFPDDNKISFELSSADKSWTYTFAKRDKVYFAKRNDRESIFKIRKKDYETVENWKLDYITVSFQSDLNDSDDLNEASTEIIP